MARSRTLDGRIAVFVVVVMMVAGACSSAEANQNRCQRTIFKPDLNSIQVKNFGSNGNSFLANMAGYVEFNDGTYLQLDVESLLISGPSRYNHILVTYLGKCFSFLLQYKIDSNALFKAEMFVNDYNYEPKKICDFQPDMDVQVPKNMRYSCTKPVKHGCFNTTIESSALVANLVLKSFEFEFNYGNPAQVQRGEFGHKAWIPSCDGWKGDPVTLSS